MNGIEKIVEHIRAQSVAECEEIAKGADEECARVRAKYAQAEQDEYWKLVAFGKRELDLRIERLGSLAALEAKKQVLTMQKEMMAAAFELAAKKLLNLPEWEYIALFARLAYLSSLTGTEEVIFPPSDLPNVGEAVIRDANAALAADGKTARLTLSAKTTDIRGGFLMSGGDIEVDCSIDALLARYEHEIAPLVAAELFN